MGITPSTDLSTLRPDIRGAFLEYPLELAANGYVAELVARTVSVMSESGKFGIIAIEELLKDADTNRGPRGVYNRVTHKMGEMSYSCEEYGIEEAVSERNARQLRDYFDAEMIAASLCRGIVNRAREKRVAAALFNAAVWTGASLTTDVSNEWNDYANATPIDDVLAARVKVWNASGLWPNAVVMNRLVYAHVRNCAQVIARISGSGAGSPVKAADITAMQLAELFDVRHVIVAGQAKNAAAEGQAASIAPIWSNEYVSVCRVAETDDPTEPCTLRSFAWDEDGGVDPIMESYEEPQSRSTIVRARHNSDEVVMYKESAHLLGNITG